MAYRIIFLDEPGLEESFKHDLSRTLTQLAENPKLFQEVAPGIRIGITKRFRFRVVYELHDRHVLVAAIVHPKRHESAWRGRV